MGTEPTVVAFRAMGSPCRVVVDGGPPGLADRAVAVIADLEDRWSRFRPDSEVSAVNRRPGQVTVVSEATMRLFDHAERAMAATDGRFNPLMLDQLEAIGYRRSWSAGGHRPDPGLVTRPASSEPLAVMADANAVRLPPGCRFDPGGIGKGLAADIAVEFCAVEGATTVAVELGGDLRVHGRPWYGSTWRIGVSDPFDDDTEIASFTPAGGAVTTSSTRRRSWDGPDGRLHHLLDPATGRPAETDLVAVTTCSGSAWWAEVVAKVALVAGSEAAPGVLTALGTPGIGVTYDRRIVGTHKATAGEETTSR